MPAKIPQAEIEALIKNEEYYRVGLTITCYITTIHDFVVSGESGTIDPNNFNEEIGQQVAKRKAIDELWKLEGYFRVAEEYWMKVKDGYVRNYTNLYSREIGNSK